MKEVDWVDRNEEEGGWELASLVEGGREEKDRLGVWRERENNRMEGERERVREG